MKKIQTKFKYSPDDFIVEEIHEDWHCKISEEFEQQEIKIDESQKDFIWCEMEKREIEHFQAIKEIARHLRIHPQDIGYAGTKDKVAHTSQRISIYKPDIEKLKTFSHPKIILKNFKWNKRKIKIGYLESNHFKITLRDIDKKEAIKITNQIRKTRVFPNYFGSQRFGIEGKNLITGRLLLKREFQKAAEIMLQSQEISDSIGALKTLPRKILLMHVCSIQSKIFNEIVSQAIEEGLNLEQQGQQSGILVGYKTNFSKGRLGEIERETLKKNDIKPEDFDIREIPYLRVKGSFRKAITKIENLEIEIQDDEKFHNAKKIVLKFTLPKGNYATTFLENFFIFT